MSKSIFVSYARGDDEAFASRIHADLSACGFDVWIDRVSMPARGLTFLHEVRDAIDARERFVLILGYKSVTSSYVTAEWQYALHVGKAINPVLRLGELSLVPDELKDLQIEDFRDDAYYTSQLKKLLRQLSEPVAPMGSLFGFPSLPRHLVDRRRHLKSLKSDLLSDHQRPVVVTGVAAQVGVHGMGGIGKSTLALGLFPKALAIKLTEHAGGSYDSSGRMITQLCELIVADVMWEQRRFEDAIDVCLGVPAWMWIEQQVYQWSKTSPLHALKMLLEHVLKLEGTDREYGLYCIIQQLAALGDGITALRLLRGMDRMGRMVEFVEHRPYVSKTLSLTARHLQLPLLAEALHIVNTLEDQDKAEPMGAVATSYAVGGENEQAWRILPGDTSVRLAFFEKAASALSNTQVLDAFNEIIGNPHVQCAPALEQLSKRMAKMGRDACLSSWDRCLPALLVQPKKTVLQKLVALLPVAEEAAGVRAANALWNVLLSLVERSR